MRTYRSRNGACLMYDVNNDILWLSFPPRADTQTCFLDTAEAVREHFDDIEAHVRAVGRPQAYVVINYANFDVNPAVNHEYVAGLGRVLPLVAGVVRYGCNILQASLVRGNAFWLRFCPHLCASHQEAMALVHALRGAGTQAAPPA